MGCEEAVVDGRYYCEEGDGLELALIFRLIFKWSCHSIPDRVRVKWKHELDSGSGKEGGKKRIDCPVNVVERKHM